MPGNPGLHPILTHDILTKFGWKQEKACPVWMGMLDTHPKSDNDWDIIYVLDNANIYVDLFQSGLVQIRKRFQHKSKLFEGYISQLNDFIKICNSLDIPLPSEKKWTRDESGRLVRV